MAEKNGQNDFSKGSIPAVVMRMALPLIAAHDVRYHWVKGHAENEYNNRCDELAVAESRKYK